MEKPIDELDPQQRQSHFGSGVVSDPQRLGAEVQGDARETDSSLCRGLPRILSEDSARAASRKKRKDRLYHVLRATYHMAGGAAYLSRGGSRRLMGT